MEGEPPLWYQRFTRYRLMEPTRSIAAVFQEENSKKLEKTRKSPEPDGTWYAKAREWQWDERVNAWDIHQSQEQEKIIAKEKEQVLKSRYALVHKRIEQLDRIAQKLLDYAEEEDKVWMLDVKAIGNGPDAERVDLVRFNDALFREIRAHFADIAAELGERVKTTKQEITGKDGQPIEAKNVFTIDPKNMSAEQIATLKTLASSMKKQEQGA